MKLEQFPGQYKIMLSSSQLTTVFAAMTLQIDAGFVIDIPGVSASFDLGGTPYSFPCSDAVFTSEQIGTLSIIVPALTVGYTAYATIGYYLFDSKLGDRVLFGRLGQRDGLLTADDLPIFELFTAGQIVPDEYPPFSPHYKGYA